MLAPLATAGFFEVYDVALLTLAAPVIAGGLGVPIALFGIGVALIRLAAFGSLPLLRLADRWGRRTLLIASLALFTLATGATALAWGFVAFVGLQMIARVFLSTESALSSLVVAEELRPDRRGTGLSALGIISGLGYGAVAGLLLLVPLTPLDWQLFYIVALLPLAVAAYLRRQLPETQAFLIAKAENRVQTTLWPRVDPRHRRRLWQVIAIVAAFGFVQTSGFFYASELAQTDYGWSGLFTTLILAAAVFGVLGYWLGGRIGDLVGRRPMIALSIVLGAAGTVLVFTQVPAPLPARLLPARRGGLVLHRRLAGLHGRALPHRGPRLALRLRAHLPGRGGLGRASVVLGGLAAVVSPYLLLLILGGCLTTAVLALVGLPETACRDLVADRETGPVSAGAGAAA